MKIRSKLFGGFIVTVSITLLLGITAFVNTSQTGSEFTFLVEHDLNVLQNAQNLQKFVVDAETGQRGFVIVGEESFLEPYYSGLSGFDELIEIEDSGDGITSENLDKILIPHLQQNKKELVWDYQSVKVL